MSVSNPQSAEFRGVSVEHPELVNAAKNAKKLGWSKEEAAKRVGLPMETVDKIYNRPEK